MGLSFYQVTPRYTGGSPAQVDEATAKRVAQAEREAYRWIMQAGVGAGSERKLAENYGLAGIVEALTEQGNGWAVWDMLTDQHYIRPFTAKCQIADLVLTPEERYRRDPVFHALVKILEGQIAQGTFTPAELLEAAALACTRHAARQPDLAGLDTMAAHFWGG